MYSEFEVSVSSIFLAISLICGCLIWVRRKEVPDRSRTYLALMELISAGCSVLVLGCVILGYNILQPWTLLEPMKSLAGLYVITLAMCYPLEVMRPRQLRGRWLLLLWLPSLVVTLPFLCGLQFQQLHTWSDLREHLLDLNVLLRLLSIAFVTVYSVLLLFIPYNWRQSSADYRWIRQFTFFSQGISVLYYGHVFTNLHIFMPLHVLWGAFVMLYLTYYELYIRILPPPQKKSKLPEPEPATASAVADTVEVEEDTYDFWPNICQVMDEWEAWRNPNTTVETVSTAVGTNRIYVARCIREHTGMTFNDYMNNKRISYMADQLRLDPTQDQKHLYFDVGFRSRHTAYRNFVKFIGSSPTDFIASLS